LARQIAEEARESSSASSASFTQDSGAYNKQFGADAREPDF
jgi:hypothetical protein